MQRRMMKNCSPILLIGSLALVFLASGCATDRSKPDTIASCCATNLQPAAPTVADLSSKSIYQIDSTWTTDAGQPFKLAALQGRPQVVAMFFTSIYFTFRDSFVATPPDALDTVVSPGDYP